MVDPDVAVTDEELQAKAEAIVAKRNPEIDAARRKLWEMGISLPDKMIAAMLTPQSNIRLDDLSPKFKRRGKAGDDSRRARSGGTGGSVFGHAPRVRGDPGGAE